MKVEHVDFLVEEPSMEVFLRGLLPGLVEDLDFSIHPFQGKQDLLDNIFDRLRGYAHWLPESFRIVVLVDQDEKDCRELKEKLEEYACKAGLTTRSQNQSCFTVVNRIVISELEAWYFGDWDAVVAAYPRVSKSVPRQASYRNPDAIEGGTWEAFERLLKRAGYFKTGLRKIEAAQTIAPHIDPARNVSHSFQVFRAAALELAGCV